MKEHNYAFQNADTRPRLQRRTQNTCFVISISAVILKRMVKITSIFGATTQYGATLVRALDVSGSPARQSPTVIEERERYMISGSAARRLASRFQ